MNQAVTGFLFRKQNLELNLKTGYKKTLSEISGAYFIKIGLASNFSLAQRAQRKAAAFNKTDIKSA
jgi:hypothetical protein